ncbi:MAG TPA: C39 family peptidase, partial [Patescibacteria group bacterium]|nr:C39 family peptidase [Patescibacteria group bacterium]
MEDKKLIHPIKFTPKKRTAVLVALATILTVLSAYLGLTFTSPTQKETPKDKFGQILAVGETAVPFVSPPASHFLPSSKWIPQTFNNCGPAAVSMALQHFGYTIPQEETKRKLRTGDDDKNIFMYQIKDYLKKDFGIESKILVNGDIDTIKTLIANGIYVMVEDWLSPGEDIGHVLVITGYDDNEGVLIADDSYFGVNIKYPYQTWEETQWKPYNREFMPVYNREKENLVKAIVGENWSENTMYRNAIAASLKEVNSNPNDMYALFNLGSNYFAIGE